LSSDLSVATLGQTYGLPLLSDILACNSSEELARLACPLPYVHGGMPLELDPLGNRSPM
jgi:hypothetical protein